MNSQTDENVTIENLRQFVRRHSDIKIALSDCLPQFDAYAAEFVKALQLTSIESKQLQAIVRDAHNQSTKLETEQVFAIGVSLYCMAFSFF